MRIHPTLLLLAALAAGACRDLPTEPPRAVSPAADGAWSAAVTELAVEPMVSSGTTHACAL